MSFPPQSQSLANSHLAPEMTGNGLFISVDSTHSQAIVLQLAVSDDDPLQLLPNPARAGLAWPQTWIAGATALAWS